LAGVQWQRGKLFGEGPKRTREGACAPGSAIVKDSHRVGGRAKVFEPARAGDYDYEQEQDEELT
jgi:hypothetical protein